MKFGCGIATYIMHFCMDSICPKDDRSALQPRSNSSSPGPDSINYAILTKLPAAHHCLATLYTQILKYGSPPPQIMDKQQYNT